jgi:hypothetical protein
MPLHIIETAVMLQIGQFMDGGLGTLTSNKRAWDQPENVSGVNQTFSFRINHRGKLKLEGMVEDTSASNAIPGRPENVKGRIFFTDFRKNSCWKLKFRGLVRVHDWQ